MAGDTRRSLKLFLVVSTCLTVMTFVHLLTSMRYLHTAVSWSGRLRQHVAQQALLQEQLRNNNNNSSSSSSSNKNNNSSSSSSSNKNSSSSNKNINSSSSNKNINSSSSNKNNNSSSNNNSNNNNSSSNNNNSSNSNNNSSNNNANSTATAQEKTASLSPSSAAKGGSNAGPKGARQARTDASRPPEEGRKGEGEAGAKARPMRCQDCFTHDFRYVIQNESICRSTGKDDVIDLLVLVTTVHSHREARQAVRDSWLSVARGNRGHVRYAFLLGETFNDTIREELRREAGQQGDLLMEDFKDHYLNLTLKTLMGFKWAVDFCRRARFLLKTDDDMWVNVPSLLALLRVHHKRLQTNLGGACSSSGSPIRNPRSKWYASLQSYPQTSYQGYCSGTAYVASMAVVERVYRVSPSVPFFHLEDVYVGLCLRAAGLHLVNLPGFHRGGTSQRPCDLRSPRIVTSHRVRPEVMLRAWSAQCGNSTA